MTSLKPFQSVDSSAFSQRVALVQTLEFSDLLDTTAEHGDVGYYSAPGSIFNRFPSLQVDGEAVIAVTVPPYIEVSWPAQTADWLIPYNTTDWDGGPLQTMLRLGTGSLALDYAQASDVLERVEEALIVVYVLPDCLASVRYRWSRMLLESLEGLAQSTRFYQSVIAENATYNVRAQCEPTVSHLRAVYGSIRQDGNVFTTV